MNVVRQARWLAVAVYCFLLWFPARAQQTPGSGCSIAAVVPASDKPNIFSPQQEVELGDVLAEIVRSTNSAIEDEQLNAYLRKIGERLTKNLPSTGLDYRFSLFNLPAANAISIAGGRIYVSRKLVGFARNEDEVAGVLAHELGHVVTHQSAIDFSRYFKEALGVTQVSDRKDIEDKIHRLIESRKSVSTDMQQHQLEADRVGVETLARAGYSVQAFSEFYDRLANNKGRVGNWFTDLFGSTGPDSKRFREMRQVAEKIPAGCITRLPESGAADFKAWQAAVVEYSGTSRSEQVKGLLARKTLDPPLQDEIHTLRFSYDGRYLIAQDEATIYVLSREPFHVKFQIPAPEAYPAQFTVDSKYLSFYNPDLRAEVWDVERGQRTEAYEIVSSRGCMQTALSPDAKTLACIDAKNDFILIDSATGDRIFEKKELREGGAGFERRLSGFRFIYELDYVNMGFSLDGRYFVTSGKQHTTAVDVSARKEIPLSGSEKSWLSGGFAFLGPKRIVGRNKGSQGAVFSFPEGEMERSVELGAAAPARVAKGDYVLLRPIRDYEVGVLDLKTNQIIRASKKPAIDIYGDVAAGELGSGEVALFGASATPIARARLSRGHFGPLRVVAASDDLNWLAVSSRQRGAVWNLSNGARLYSVKGFRGAFFGPDGALYVDFPKQGNVDRAIARMDLSRFGITLAQNLGAGRVRQVGRHVFSWKPAGGEDVKDKEKADADDEEKRDYRYEGIDWRYRSLILPPRENETLEVKESVNGRVLWTRRFNRTVPRVDFNVSAGVIALSWRLGTEGVRAEMREVPNLHKPSSGGKDEDYLIEIVDLETGKVLGGIVFATNEGRILLEQARPAPEWVAIEDSFGRTLVYSLATGANVGKLFGTPRALSSRSKSLFLNHGSGRADIYDLATFEKRQSLVFPYGVSTAMFSQDGKKLCVLTDDQTLYVIDPAVKDEKLQAASGRD